MKSVVYFGTARQAQLKAAETLPCKLDLIVERLKVRERVKDERVAIKMHVGDKVGYSTVHPLFVRRVVRAVLDGGGKPFITDTSGAAATAYERGYTAETLGCPVYPAAGPDEKYFYTHEQRYKNMEQWRLAGHLRDATFLIDLAHVKGHPTCSYGGAIKNLALGAMTATTRGAIHDTFHHDAYWFPEKCPDASVIDKIIEACPFGALVRDKEDPRKLHLHNEPCNQCGRCLKVAPEGSLKIDPINFRSFMEACAISTKICLDTFEREKTVFINIANNITPVCDCFGFTGPAVLNDLGVLGSNDIVAIDQATLDLLAPFALIRENVPPVLEVQSDAGHPLAQLHGPYKDPYIVVEECAKLGLGSRDYELVDVLPYKPDMSAARYTYVSAADL
ncbi:hypothetical protein AMJ85_07250 [candidate division BRC1 bacterium SM23_51]|nr:MAG: hypothetical protein AMJ85_07250 [candidate division BRC1 bacterium SM23_51]